jgi:hypothetical protein
LFLLLTRYQALLYEPRRKEERSKSKNLVTCHLVHFPISMWRFCTKSLAHATAAAVVVVAGATASRLPPLHLHHHCRLRPLHTTECWSTPRPLPPTGRRTIRWCSWTPTPIQGVVRVGRVLSTVGIVPTELHWSMTHHHRAIGGRRRKEKKKTMSATSRWSPAPLGRRRYARWHASPLVHGADPKDRWHHGPPPHRQPCRLLPGPRRVCRRHFLQARQALRALDAARSKEYVWHPATPSICPPCRTIWQRSSTRVVGLDG